MKKGCLLLMLLLYAVANDCIYAQIPTYRQVRREAMQIVHHYEDNLTDLIHKYFPERDSLYVKPYYGRRTEHNPRFFKLFVPLTYYYAPIKDVFTPEWSLKEPECINYPVQELFPIDTYKLTPTERINKSVSQLLVMAYLQYPERVVTTEGRIARRRRFQEKAMPKTPPKTPLIDLFKPDVAIEEKVAEVAELEADFIVKKPNFWHTGGSGSLQFTQNYISDNWHKGGESTKSLLSNLELKANYNDKNRIEFDNKLLVKIGFITAPSDTLHSYKPNDDLIRLTSKLGVKAISNWYYTLSGEFNTQFFSTYKTNSNDLQSAFFSPANFYLSLGMDYKLKKKRIELSIVLSPASYNYRYIANEDVDPSLHGMKNGRRTMNDIGSQIQSTMKWTVIPSIVWESNFKYYTNYEKVEAEWENTFNFVLNRYLSTKLFVHPRFDDSGKKSKKDSYFQLKELLSFGVNYSW